MALACSRGESTTRVEMTMAIVGQEMVTEMVMTTTLELIEDGVR